MRKVQARLCVSCFKRFGLALPLKPAENKQFNNVCNILKWMPCVEIPQPVNCLTAHALLKHDINDNGNMLVQVVLNYIAVGHAVWEAVTVATWHHQICSEDWDFYLDFCLVINICTFSWLLCGYIGKAYLVSLEFVGKQPRLSCSYLCLEFLAPLPCSLSFRWPAPCLIVSVVSLVSS